MRDKLRSRPTRQVGRNVPVRWVYRISGGQETLLRAVQFFDCGFQIGHCEVSQKAKYYKSFTQTVLLRRSRRQLAQTRVPVAEFAIRRTPDQTAATPLAESRRSCRKGPRSPARLPE